MGMITNALRAAFPGLPPVFHGLLGAGPAERFQAQEGRDGNADVQGAEPGWERVCAYPRGTSLIFQVRLVANHPHGPLDSAALGSGCWGCAAM